MSPMSLLSGWVVDIHKFIQNAIAIRALKIIFYGALQETIASAQALKFRV